MIYVEYHPIFETPPMQFVSCITGGIVSSVTGGLILWNKKLFPLLSAILAAAILFSKYNQHSPYWTGIDFVAIAIGFAVVPLLVVLLEFRARRNGAKAQ